MFSNDTIALLAKMSRDRRWPARKTARWQWSRWQWTRSWRCESLAGARWDRSHL